MMKRISALLSIIVICLCVLPSAAGFKAFADDNYHATGDIDSQRSGLVDEKGLYNVYGAEFSELDKVIKDTSRELQLNIIVFLAGTSRSESSTINYICDLYDSTFGEDTDGVAYYLDISGQSPATDHITLSGMGVKYKQSLDSIFYHLDNYLPSSDKPIVESDITTAVKEFTEQLKYYSNNTVSSLDYYYDSDTGKYFYFRDGELLITKSKPITAYKGPFVISLIIGILTAIITYFCVKSSYKFKSKTNPSVYVEDQSTRFTVSNDILTNTHTSRHKIESNSGGGRSGGGGGRSFSGGHVGGSHHR